MRIAPVECRGNPRCAITLCKVHRVFTKRERTLKSVRITEIHDMKDTIRFLKNGDLQTFQSPLSFWKTCAEVPCRSINTRGTLKSPYEELSRRRKCPPPSGTSLRHASVQETRLTWWRLHARLLSTWKTTTWMTTRATSAASTTGLEPWLINEHCRSDLQQTLARMPCCRQVLLRNGASCRQTCFRRLTIWLASMPKYFYECLSTFRMLQRVALPGGQQVIRQKEEAQADA